MVSIIVELRDNNGVVREQRLDFDSQMSVNDLKAELYDSFAVSTKHQEIFHKEKRIDLLRSNLNMADYTDGLILKHEFLKQWVAFKEAYDNLKPMKKENIKLTHLSTLMEYAKLLVESKFFVAYEKFYSVYTEFNRNYAHFFDNNVLYIEHAARGYFLYHYLDLGNVEVKTKPKGNLGAQGGIMCEVNLNGKMLAKFHVKCPYGTSSHTSEHSKVDLRELFAYKLLEIIKVGPPVHFVRNVHKSTCGIYIATQDVEGFQEKQHAQVDNPGKLEVQLQLLGHIFKLSDIADRNYGINSQQELVILHFGINGESSADMKNYIKSKKSKYSAELKECLERWNLENAVEEADKKINKEKAYMKKDQIYNKLIKSYTEYLEDIKKRISDVVKILEDEEGSTSEEHGSSAKKPKLN